MISVIIPMLNEELAVAATLRPLQSLRERGHQVIVVDGGSCDRSVKVAEPYVDRLILVDDPEHRGRANQMNRGAACAQGDILLFLHADTRLSPAAVAFLLDMDFGTICGESAQSMLTGWGFFGVTLSGSSRVFRLIEALITFRSRFTSVATGDQAIFVGRKLFAESGGFPSIPLMEDVALSKRLRERARPVRPDATVNTSSRRWEARGVFTTIFLMWSLRLAYWMNIDPKLLARVYR